MLANPVNMALNTISRQVIHDLAQERRFDSLGAVAYHPRYDK